MNGGTLKLAGTLGLFPNEVVACDEALHYSSPSTQLHFLKARSLVLYFVAAGDSGSKLRAKLVHFLPTELLAA